ncbi:mitochondrial import protein Pam17 [Dentipellis sp. KUC8613]|nr:mitochondrial import protein Pam17 [Dentipellis sp. KUC8613]
MASLLQRHAHTDFMSAARGSIARLHSVDRPSRVLVRSKTTASAAPQEKQTLSWPDYLTIRKKKRRYEMVLTAPCMLAGLAGGASYFGQWAMEAPKHIMGIEPIFFFGGATLTCVGAGYLLGPIIGSAVWRMTHRSTLPLIEARDREFHKHIVENRVDPTAQSASNPVPDFYGEKIGSLHDYRQWLRDQAKYRRKSEWPEDER